MGKGKDQNAQDETARMGLSMGRLAEAVEHESVADQLAADAPHNVPMHAVRRISLQRDDTMMGVYVYNSNIVYIFVLYCTYEEKLGGGRRP